jgi:Na+-transporting NADH:ubiquinone oxidoreductase subunit NqrC
MPLLRRGDEMKILVSGDYVDFEAPIYMTYEKQKQFIAGMKAIFKDNVDIEEIIENKKELSFIDRNPKKFTDEDKKLLANFNLSNEELAIKIGKSSFAIQMRRGPFIMEIQEWASKKGKNKITASDIKEFLEETK